jgi:hypothetical protein
MCSAPIRSRSFAGPGSPGVSVDKSVGRSDAMRRSMLVINRKRRCEIDQPSRRRSWW